MKKIKIAESCHEDWSEFTPTQKGAFCGKCAIDVIDFSEKSNSEIKSILEENQGKHMCGRFGKIQLVDFNLDYSIWQDQQKSTFQSKFLYALVLAFGLSLFSCSGSHEQHIAGEIEQISTIIDSIPNNGSAPRTDSIITCTEVDEEFEKGDIEYIPETDIDILKGEMILESEPVQEINHKMGKIKIDEPKEIEIMDMGIIATEPDIEQ